AGVDKIRLNPGNIRDPAKVEMVVKAAAERRIPIRIGVNAGSLDPELLRKYGGPTPEAMVESAANEIALLERLNFYDIVVSLKSSDVMECARAYLLFARKFSYPLHVGITEAGLAGEGVIYSAAGIGIVLAHGVGDTIRVSLTAHPVEEVHAGFTILRALGLRRCGVRIIACPMCGRHEIDVKALAEEVREATQHIKVPLEIAVMGCVVNGPGEARRADVGIAGGRNKVAVFMHGKVVSVVPPERALSELIKLAEQCAMEQSKQLHKHKRMCNGNES
ncbi:MAG TPA: (E)-4-hydroxy-3-methylbut-2-enyl-diphosphate synthase, partial [Armatimonadetes bacterium]|nr:(E)-4-hydroxy-3-methylbut-2-enyl-diphosphate synthase [Armatimonadota bacterium]